VLTTAFVLGKSGQEADEEMFEGPCARGWRWSGGVEVSSG